MRSGTGYHVLQVVERQADAAPALADIARRWSRVPPPAGERALRGISTSCAARADVCVRRAAAVTRVAAAGPARGVWCCARGRPRRTTARCRIRAGRSTAPAHPRHRAHRGARRLAPALGRDGGHRPRPPPRDLSERALTAACRRRAVPGDARPDAADDDARSGRLRLGVDLSVPRHAPAPQRRCCARSRRRICISRACASPTTRPRARAVRSRADLDRSATRVAARRSAIPSLDFMGSASSTSSPATIISSSCSACCCSAAAARRGAHRHRVHRRAQPDAGAGSVRRAATGAAPIEALIGLSIALVADREPLARRRAAAAPCAGRSARCSCRSRRLARARPRRGAGADARWAWRCSPAATSGSSRAWHGRPRCAPQWRSSSASCTASASPVCCWSASCRASAWPRRCSASTSASSSARSPRAGALARAAVSPGAIATAACSAPSSSTARPPSSPVGVFLVRQPLLRVRREIGR